MNSLMVIFVLCNAQKLRSVAIQMYCLLLQGDFGDDGEPGPPGKFIEVKKPQDVIQGPKGS